MYQLAVEALHSKARNQISGQPLCISGAKEKKGKAAEGENGSLRTFYFYLIFLFSRGRAPSGLLVSYNSIRPKKKLIRGITYDA